MIVLRELHVEDFKPLRGIHLAFPDRATILIEGLNEAGKSTLFEAIYFALYGECLPNDEPGSRGSGFESRTSGAWESDTGVETPENLSRLATAESRLASSPESTIRYGADKAVVELTLSVAGTDLTVRRIVRPGRAGEVSLRIQRPGGPPEVVTDAGAANHRLLAELGQPDSGTLLSSCFVEQKKLERLEDLDPAERRAVIL